MVWRMDQGSSTAAGNLLGGRIRSLDGLRGIAALVVLLTHAILTVPSIHAATESGATFGSVEWAMTFTPAHIFWAGSEAVFLFFVLSGIVLAIPALKSGRFSWLSYYPKRLARLYLPVWAAIVFTIVLVLLLPRGGDASLGGWISARPTEYPISEIIKDAVMLRATSGVNGPLWSLRFEIYFSLLLPLYIGAVLFLRRWWTAKAVTLGILLVASSWVRQELVFLMLIFAVGVLIVDGWDRISRVLNSMRWRGAWPALLTLALLLTCSRWLLRAVGVDDDLARRFYFLSVIGVTIFVVAAIVYRPFSDALSRRTSIWLGRVSFSLYLTHEPILIAVRSATPEISPWLTAPIGIAVSLVVAEIFFRAVEKPSHRFAQAVGRAVDGWRASRSSSASRALPAAE